MCSNALAIAAVKILPRGPALITSKSWAIEVEMAKSKKAKAKQREEEKKALKDAKQQEIYTNTLEQKERGETPIGVCRRCYDKH